MKLMQPMRDATGRDAIPGIPNSLSLFSIFKRSSSKIFGTPGMVSLSSIVAALFLFSACSQHLSEANLKQVRPEMSPKEVESILGQPARVEKFTMEMQRSGPEGIRYFYEQDGKTIVLHFVDGKLISQVPTWNENKIEQPAK